jgi:hypothetical protein
MKINPYDALLLKAANKAAFNIFIVAAQLQQANTVNLRKNRQMPP